MDATFSDWSRVMKVAEAMATKGEIDRATALVDVAAEIRSMMLGQRQIAVHEANAGGMRMVVQATTQNEHTVNRPADTAPKDNP